MLDATDYCLRKAQSGRSMVEMLGVLAVIGVLSVGGIAGYTKAMTKYKINKTIDQITQLAQNIRAFYVTQKNYYALGDAVIKKAHLVPEEMWNSNGTGLEHPFGGSVQISSSGKYLASGNDFKAFVIWLYDVPEEACMEFLTQDWGAGSSSGFIAIGGGRDAYTAYLGENTSYYAMMDSYGYTSGFRDDVTFASEGIMGLDKAALICGSDSYNSPLMLKFY